MGLRFSIDSNCINARQKNRDLNQIEAWVDDDIIELLLPEAVFKEVSGTGLRWRQKANKHIRAEDCASTAAEQAELAEIATIIFPEGCKSAGDRMDVRIVFNAISTARC